jgi:serine/threonine protein kinase
MDSLIGQSLGRYHILEQLGEGGMATVYKGFDTRLERNVAVKVLRTDQFAPAVISRALKRFEREAKALGQLTHPNIVPIIDYGEFEGKPYLVMPFIPGQTLKHRLKGQPIPYEEAVRILLPIARSLEYAHQQGVIHRDIKPSNVLITESGEPMLSDFGVAKIVDEEATMDLTGTSASVGTPEYMAPEQATSKVVDARVDIYSLGIVFYEMVTGRKPYVADTPLAVLIKHASEPLPRPKLLVPTLPDRVEQIILKALAKKPEDRYQTMGEFAAALERCLAEATTHEMKIKSAQAAAKQPRVEVVAARIEKAQMQKGTPPIAAKPPEGTTSRDISKPESKTVVRGTSAKRMILISGGAALAAIVCLGAVLIATNRWSTSKFGMRTEPSGTNTLNIFCPTSSLTEPVLQSPDDFSIITSLSPDFAWTYPDISCHPQGYRIDLSQDRDFADKSLSGGTGNPSTSWSPDSNLQPGIEYFWKVAAINDVALGPYSTYRRFFIGPYCDSAKLVGPVLVWPADGEIIDTNMPGLHWANGNTGCLPQGYGIHLSADPSFADISLNGGTGNPDQYWYPGHDLADCTTYYWNVFAGMNTTFGSESSTHSFRTNFGGTACATTVPQPVPSVTSAPSATFGPSATSKPQPVPSATSVPQPIPTDTVPQLIPTDTAPQPIPTSTPIR